MTMMSKLTQFNDVFRFSLQIRVITSFFQVICSAFLKGTHLAFEEMESFARELDYLYS